MSVFLSLFFLSYVSAVSFENQTIFFERVSNTTIRIENNITLDVLDINETYQGILLYNLQDSYDIFSNINASSTSRLLFYNLTNALLYFNNGSICGSSDIGSNDGNINCTFNANSSLILINNNTITPGIIVQPTAPQSTSNPQGTFSQTFNLNNTLVQTINNSFVTNVTSCNIQSVSFNSALGFLYNPSYSCSNNILTILSLENIAPSQTGNTLTVTYSNPAQIADPVICSSTIGGIAGFFTSYGTIFSVLGIIFILIPLAMVLLYFVKGRDENFLSNVEIPQGSILWVGLVFGALIIIAIIAVISIIAINAACVVGS